MMDFIIVFFRDILDGPLYYVIVSICSILICSCIGYMGERYLKQKKEIEEQEKVNESIAMTIDELASLTKIQQVAAEQGLSYNNNNIKTRR